MSRSKFKSSKRMNVVMLALLAAFILSASAAYSYLDEVSATSSGVVPSRWNFGSGGFPVQWNLNPAAGANITGAQSVASVIQSSFNTWTSAPNASLPVTRGADSAVTSEASSPHNINLICFVCTDGDFSKDSETLAVTMTTTQTAVGQDNFHGGTTQFAGQIVKSDILFNPNTQFSTDATGSGQDLQTVATHEIGHFFGLDHSGVVRAIMFPFAPPVEQTLSYDDVAGISNLYPKGSQDFATVSISGVVQMANTGAAIFGAHVYAGSTTNAINVPGNIRKSPIGTLTLPDGSYSLQGLPPDSYIVTAEPIDGPMSASDVSGFGAAFNATPNTAFTTRWH